MQGWENPPLNKYIFLWVSHPVMIHDLNRRAEGLTIGDEWRISVSSVRHLKTSCLLKDTTFFLMEKEYITLDCFFLIMCQMSWRNQKISSTVKHHLLLCYQVDCMLKFCAKGFKDDSAEAIFYFALSTGPLYRSSTITDISSVAVGN